jgi:hypothetical protein
LFGAGARDFPRTPYPIRGKGKGSGTHHLRHGEDTDSRGIVGPREKTGSYAIRVPAIPPPEKLLDSTTAIPVYEPFIAVLLLIGFLLSLLQPPDEEIPGLD